MNKKTIQKYIENGTLKWDHRAIEKSYKMAEFWGMNESVVTREIEAHPERFVIIVDGGL